jgi:hypothetical protein
VGIDVDPVGNTATSLGSIEQCVSVASGDIFDIDVFVDAIPLDRDFMAFGYRLNYDSTVLDATAMKHDFLVTVDADSELLDLSTLGMPVNVGVPDKHFVNVGVVDKHFPPAEASEPGGSLGVLGRYTFRAVGSGVAVLTLTRPRLGDSSAEEILVDEIHDGNWTPPYGIIAVDEPCGAPTPAVSPTAIATAALTATAPLAPTATTPAPGVPPSTAQDSTPGPADMPWIAVYAAVGAIVVLLLGALALSRARRR